VSNLPDRHDDEDPFAGLPPELRAMLEQLGGPEGLAAAQEQIAGMLGGLGGPGGLGAMFGAGGTPPTGPVDWSLGKQGELKAVEGEG
jgi:hypothetical protein